MTRFCCACSVEENNFMIGLICKRASQHFTSGVLCADKKQTQPSFSYFRVKTCRNYKEERWNLTGLFKEKDSSFREITNRTRFKRSVLPDNTISFMTQVSKLTSPSMSVRHFCPWHRSFVSQLYNMTHKSTHWERFPCVYIMSGRGKMRRFIEIIV